MKKLSKIILSFVVSLTLSVGVWVTPASAAISDCPYGQFCAWDGTNYTSTRWQYAYGNYGPTWTCRNLPASQNNKWSSYYNGYGSGLVVKAYINANCSESGSWYMISNGGFSSNAGPGEVSSFMIQNIF